MSESDCHHWLSKADLNKQQNDIKITVADIDTIADTSMSAVKSDVHVLPLSLETELKHYLSRNKKRNLASKKAGHMWSLHTNDEST